MSRRIIIPKGLVNPGETTVIEIPEELSEERELIASPTCPTSCVDSGYASESPASSPSAFVPPAMSTLNPPVHDQTWTVPTYSSIYDSSAMSYSMEPTNSVFGETYDVPPRNPCPASYGSDRSQSFGQTYSMGSNADATYNIPSGRSQTMSDRSQSLDRSRGICPGANNTYGIASPGAASHFGKTQTMSDRSESFGKANRTYAKSPGVAPCSGRTQTLSPAPDRTFNVPQNRTFNMPQNRTCNVPQNHTFNVPPNHSYRMPQTDFGRTRTISTSPSSRPADSGLTTTIHSTTSILETTYPNSDNFTPSFSMPPATSTPLQHGQTFTAPRRDQTWTAPPCSTLNSSNEDWESNQPSSHLGGTYNVSSFGSSSYSTPGYNEHFSGNMSSFGPQAYSTPVHNAQYAGSANHQYGTPGGSSPYTGRSNCLEGCTGITGNDMSRGRSVNRRPSASSNTPQGVPSRITRTISKTYVTPMPRGDNITPSGGSSHARCRPARSQTKITKKTSKTFIKCPAQQSDTLQSSSSAHSEISSCYNDMGRIKTRPESRPSPDRTQSQSPGLGFLGNAYLNSTRHNETPPPAIGGAYYGGSPIPSPPQQRIVKKISKTRTEITTSGHPGQGRSGNNAMQAELQRMEDTERSQLHDELRTFQDSRRNLMGNTSFTYGERSSSVPGRRQCPGPCHSTT